MERILAHHVSDQTLFQKALVLLYTGAAAADAGDNVLAARVTAEGLPILVALASKPHSSPTLCLFAAHNLDRVGGDPAQALAFASRAVQDGNLGPDARIDLAIAEVRTGNQAAAERDARIAAAALVGTTGGYNQFRKEEISRVLHQPLPPPDPSDHGPIYKGKAGFPDLTPPKLPKASRPDPHPLNNHPG